jgi:hypothetical protein
MIVEMDPTVTLCVVTVPSKKKQPRRMNLALKRTCKWMTEEKDILGAPTEELQ